MKRERIFLIGPGGVGKTTVGRLLAPHLGYGLLDLDEEFCSRVRPIRNFLDAHGYAAYVRRNAELFHELLALYGPASGTLFVLSSGFLATDVEPEVIAHNRAMVRAAGVSVLLMPSPDFGVSLEVVLARQMGRGLNLEPETQARTFRDRFEAYMQLGNVQVFSAVASEEVARLIAQELDHHMTRQLRIG